MRCTMVSSRQFAAMLLVGVILPLWVAFRLSSIDYIGMEPSAGSR